MVVADILTGAFAGILFWVWLLVLLQVFHTRELSKTGRALFYIIFGAPIIALLFFMLMHDQMLKAICAIVTCYALSYRTIRS